jgi:hypothetical protein
VPHTYIHTATNRGSDDAEDDGIHMQREKKHLTDREKDNEGRAGQATLAQQQQQQQHDVLATIARCAVCVKLPQLSTRSPPPPTLPSPWLLGDASFAFRRCSSRSRSSSRSSSTSSSSTRTTWMTRLKMK